MPGTAASPINDRPMFENGSGEVFAAARVLEAEAVVLGARSTWLPTVGVGGSATRAKSSLAAMGGFGSIYRTSYGASAQASYELDLWGKLSSTG